MPDPFLNTEAAYWVANYHGSIDSTALALAHVAGQHTHRRQATDAARNIDAVDSVHYELRSLADDTFDRVDQIRIRRGLAPDADELERAVTFAFGGGAWSRWKQWHADPAYEHVPTSSGSH